MIYKSTAHGLRLIKTKIEKQIVNIRMIAKIFTTAIALLLVSTDAVRVSVIAESENRQFPYPIDDLEDDEDLEERAEEAEHEALEEFEEKLEEAGEEQLAEEPSNDAELVEEMPTEPLAADEEFLQVPETDEVAATLEQACA